MEKISYKINKPTPPAKVIFLFISIILFVSFYESKRVVMWETQREGAGSNSFGSAALFYASESETLKQLSGLSGFFEKEHDLWLEAKKSPVLFQQTSTLGVRVGDGEGTPKGGDKAIARGIKGPTAGKNSSTSSEALQKTEPPFKVLVIGDSFMAVGGGLGDPLESALLKYKDTTVFRLGRVSSGLSRSDYFNWELTAGELIGQQKPNVAVIMFGSNDNQGILNPDGKVVSYGGEDWNEEYAKKVSNILDMFAKENIKVFWIGIPVMKSEGFSKSVKNLNSIYENTIKKYDNAYFVPTWNLLADEGGNYSAYLPDESGKYRLARISDGVHLQYFGGGIIVKEVIGKMAEKMKLELKATKTKK